MSEPRHHPAASAGLVYLSATDVDGLTVADVMHADVACRPAPAAD